jgi:ABC-type nitrate/sulfonate/bicarbonate transport system permease component
VTRRRPSDVLAQRWRQAPRRDRAASLRAALQRFAPGALSVLGAIGLWEILSVSGVLSPDHFPTVPQVAENLGALVSRDRFWSAVGSTMQGWAVGLGIAAAIALPIGLLLGSSRAAYRALQGVIEFLRPIPSVAIIPLVVLVYGTSMTTKVFLIAYASFWPLLVQTIYGVREVDPVARETARSFGLGRAAILYRITLPSALPYFATGLRIASSIALILAITAELVVGADGLGQAILLAQSGNAIAEMYALIAVTGFLGLASNTLFRRAERTTLHWHRSQRLEREAT